MITVGDFWKLPISVFINITTGGSGPPRPPFCPLLFSIAKILRKHAFSDTELAIGPQAGPVGHGVLWPPPPMPAGGAASSTQLAGVTQQETSEAVA